MERSDITATDNKEKRWCILRHPDADLIGEILSGKRKVFDASGEVSYSYDFFIPFQDLKLRRRKAQESPEDDFKDYDAMLDERALRSDLHHFIFIHESKDNVKKLLNASWNKALSHRLYAYRDEHGDPVEVSNAEVERFKTVIKRYDFQIVNGEPTDEVREGDRVTVISGPMAGSDGIIKEIREREGQILLTITFAMFQDKMHVGAQQGRPAPAPLPLPIYRHPVRRPCQPRQVRRPDAHLRLPHERQRRGSPPPAGGGTAPDG